MRLVVITGLSGAGKSTALNALEDIGFFAVDNLPPSLWFGLVEAIQDKGNEDVVVGIDIRVGTSFLNEVQRTLEHLERAAISATAIFLDANDEALVRRFNFTRRTHPLSEGSLGSDIASERTALAPLRSVADEIIDTSTLSAKDLTLRLRRRFVRDSPFTLRVVSFGYKRGVPTDVDLVLDVRGLPNPFYDPGLRSLPGTEPAVQSYVFTADGLDLYSDLRTLIATLSNLARDGTRTSYSVAVGCTGGQHRSVAVVERLNHDLASKFQVQAVHRDLDSALAEHRDE